ncbi:MAG: hypothetical protein ACF788_08125, partial [Novipirellula sp. JB048]
SPETRDPSPETRDRFHETSRSPRQGPSSGGVRRFGSTSISLVIEGFIHQPAQHIGSSGASMLIVGRDRGFIPQQNPIDIALCDGHQSMIDQDRVLRCYVSTEIDWMA